METGGLSALVRERGADAVRGAGAGGGAAEWGARFQPAEHPHPHTKADTDQPQRVSAAAV